MSAESPDISILRSLRNVSKDSIYLLATKEYRKSYLDNLTANEISWTDFKVKANPIHVSALPNSDLEALLVPKSRTWSYRDINIYIGSDYREIKAFNDFSPTDFCNVFNWNIRLAKKLSTCLCQQVNVAHGYNPDDTSPDAHSIRRKFHTHIFVPDIDHRTEIKISELSWYDKLKTIEPYSDIFADYAKNYLIYNKAHSSFSIENFQAHNGFFSIQNHLDEIDMNYWQNLHELLYNMQIKYNEVVHTFTDGSVESYTSHERPIPFNRERRINNIENFIQSNTEWLTERSVALLRGLSSNIVSAAPRRNPKSTEIANYSQLWIAKGFSGAINFSVLSNANLFKFDFAPRIISTSGATKFITDNPTIVIKDNGTASPEELQVLYDFENLCVNFADHL